MYIGGHISKHCFEWQIGPLWGFHGRYGYWVIRWTKDMGKETEHHITLLGGK